MHTLKSLRVYAGMNQDEWAKSCGVTRQTVSAWEKGKCEPTLTELRRMSDITGISIDDIVLTRDSLEMNNKEGQNEMEQES